MPIEKSYLRQPAGRERFLAELRRNLALEVEVDAELAADCPIALKLRPASGSETARALIRDTLGEVRMNFSINPSHIWVTFDSSLRLRIPYFYCLLVDESRNIRKGGMFRPETAEELEAAWQKEFPKGIRNKYAALWIKEICVAFFEA